MPKALIPLKKRLVAYRKAATKKIGMNLSSLFSIVKDSITLNFFKIRMDKAGNIKVEMNIRLRHISTLMNDNLHIPDMINITNIHVGNKIG